MKTTIIVLIFMLLFLSFGAIYGGTLFLLQPDGSAIGMTVDQLKLSIFKDFFIPGLILLIIFGFFPIFLVFAIIKKPKVLFFEKLNFWAEYHFAFSFTFYTGIVLISWIHIQMIILKTVNPLHTIFTFYGLLLIIIVFLPSTRKYFQFKK